MKKFSLLILTIISLFGFPALYGQLSISDEVLSQVHEKIELTTDRSIYSVNDQILFRAYYQNSAPLNGKIWSSVLYAELIKPDGTPVVQKKFTLDNNGASCQFSVPQDLYTGVYYLRAYTKWMRNYSPYKYAYTQVKIININNKRLIHTESECASDKAENPIEATPDLVISSNKKAYLAREKAVVTIAKTNQLSTKSGYSISVVKKGSKENYTTPFKSGFDKNKATSDSVVYLPEQDGITISGTVVDRNKENVPNAVVHLVLLNDQPFLSAAITSDKGRFHFRIPYNQSRKDFFITARLNDQNLSVIIDKEFCDKPIQLCPTKFNLSAEEKEIAKEFAVNNQINKQYQVSTSPKIDTIAPTQNLSFYGTPNHTALIGYYIDLPYIEEFIFELIPEFIVTHRRNKTNIKTKEQNTFSPFPVLVLVDNIPVDLSTFLKLRTNKVERIEYIDDAYVVGKLKYNGIMNAITVKQDLAGIELPNNSSFFSYRLFSKNTHENSQIAGVRQPYRPNCLYWNPEFRLKDNESNTFSFTTPDTKGEYQIIVQFLENGQIRKSIKEFRVE